MGTHKKREHCCIQCNLYQTLKAHGGRPWHSQCGNMIKWEICESRGKPWHGLLVAQTGVFVFLDTASGTPGNKTWTDRFTSPIQYHCTTANQYVTSHVFYICVYFYLIVSGATEVQRAFLSFFLKFFVNEREQLSSSLSDQLLAKMRRETDFKSSTITDFLHFINFFFSFPYWNSQPFDSTHVVEGAQTEMESKQTSLISKGFRFLFKAILLK